MTTSFLFFLKLIREAAMPIYEFQCRSCNYVFELLLMSKDDIENARCPKCQSPEIGKLMSVANIGTGKSASASGKKDDGPSVKSYSCQSGSCTHINLPGYSRD